MKDFAPPQPIFSRETFAEANSREEEKSADQETLDEKYDYDSYQKGYEEVETLHSEGTAYSGSSYLSDDASPETTDYFGASIDGNIMHNINNGYVPNRENHYQKKSEISWWQSR